MMASKDCDQMSLLLSTYMDRSFLGTQEEVNIRIRSQILGEYLDNSAIDSNSIIVCGSAGEGMALPDSDIDYMRIDKTTIVMYPGECHPPNLAHKTILYIREEDCRPGYVNLELFQLGHRCEEHLFKSFVRKGSSLFVSSDIYRGQRLRRFSKEVGATYETSGPSITLGLKRTPDNVYSFPCNSWPKEAREWITRPRLHGWPCQTLIDKIVQNGCYLVPVGDKCSEDTFLQWRLSFVTAEKSLVHSFNHVQKKVYALLKYFLKQIKDNLKENIRDDDILCSYFMKIILFHAIENSSEMIWQDKNLFGCFWFCFNILIAWVKAGFCPNYFILTNNLFQRKVHGQNQQILLDVLNQYIQMKWMCLSVGNIYKPIWQSLSDVSVQTDLQRPRPVWKIVMSEDIATVQVLPLTVWTRRLTLKTVTTAMQLLTTAETNFDEIFTYHYAMKGLQILATKQINQDNVDVQGNKMKYRRLRKCKHWMIPTAVMGTELLYLATFHFLTGAFSKSLEMTRKVLELASYFELGYPIEYLRKMYNDLSLKTGLRYERLQKLFTQNLVFRSDRMCLPHLSPELRRQSRQLAIPPQPYALFLKFLCCYELGDIGGCVEALQNFKQVPYEDDQSGEKHWMFHTLLGICYQTIGDYDKAIRAYMQSDRSKTLLHECNPAFDRIAVVYLCMYASQTSDKG
ncbi:uncharacterized protein LOC132549595 [Ylistrum balloti]|uniref:uncharacterized protein LOC132549595 n=1 Tax=Ylistrum balloti TaxID=509963 RepID=UPI002905BBE2|nr:uncharacterized protein LOC132549595 [Ylistrum balloti]